MGNKLQILKKIMHYSFYILAIKILCIGMVSASEVNAQYKSIRNVQISLHEQVNTVSNVLGQIESKTDFKFSYNREDLNKRSVALAMSTATVAEVLQEISRQAYLGFKQLGNNISVTERIQTKKDVYAVVADVVISGKITDEAGEGLPGVNITLEGTSQGTISDIDGAYTLNVPEDGVLVFSHIGFLTQKVPVGNSNVINITLMEDVNSLHEMVVTGYQTLSSERAAGSFSNVNQDYIGEHPNLDLSTIIDAALPGLRTEIDVNGNATFVIRGVSTLDANAQPLIVVDGFPIEGGIETIIPNNIKSITLLKDAAAASIWGARSSNGVIVITTKDGSSAPRNGVTVSVNSFVAMGKKMDMDTAYPMADPASQFGWEEFLVDSELAGYGESLDYTTDLGIAATLGYTLLARREMGLISDTEFNTLKQALLQNDYKGDVEEYLLQNPTYQHHDFSISGSGEKSNYSLNGMYEGGNGKFIGETEEEIQLGFRSNYKLTKWLTFNIDMNFRRETNESHGLTTDEITSIASYSRLINDDGSYFSQVPKFESTINPTIGYIFQPVREEYLDNAGFEYDWNYNLLREARGRDFNTENNYTRVQAGFRVNIIKGLTWDIKGQYERRLSNSTQLYNDDTYFVRGRVNSMVDYDENTKQVTSSSSDFPSGSILRKTYGDLIGYVVRNVLNYSGTFGVHAVDFMAGTEISSTRTENNTPAIVYGYNPDKLTSVYPTQGYDNLRNFIYTGRDSYTSISNGQSFFYSDKRLFSGFVNGSYTYDDRYSLQGSIRTDASNIIVDDPKYRYSPFWSVGAAWNILGEDFITVPEWVDRLRLRMTYGKTGNIVNTASILPTITNVASSSSIDFQSYATIADYGNPTLRWEKTGTTNVGVDYSLLGNKLSGSIEYYNKSGKEIIGRIDLPVATGVSSQQFNQAEIKNTGIEFDIRYTQQIGSKVTWRNEFNMAYNKNEVLSLTRGSYSNSTLVNPHFEEGKPSNALFSYEYLGMIAGVPAIQGPNESTFPPRSAPTVLDAHDYMLYSGSTTPTWYGGLLTDLTVDRFTIALKLKAEFGSVFRAPSFQYSGPGRNALHRDAAQALNETNTDVIPGLPLEDEENIYVWNNYVQYFNTLIEDGSYIRLQEIYLAYALTDLIGGNRLNELTVFAQGRNMGLLWKANTRDLDPVYITEKPTPFYTFGVRAKF